MLEPLDAGKLRALTADEASEESSDLELAKSFFAKGGLAEGMKSLLEVFNLGIPSICRDKKNPRNWHIRFREPPFDTLSLEPCEGHIEIFKLGHFLIAFGILERPVNWPRIVQWIWSYGDEAYTKAVKRGSMLRPLDYRKLDTLIQGDNDTDCDSIRRTKAVLGKEKDLSRGIMCLFEGWKVFAPHIDRQKEVEPSWSITFCKSPFRSLRIEPGTDHGIVDIYAFEDLQTSFQVLDNSEIPDREAWQRLLRFVWDYGWKRQIHQRRWEDQQRRVPNKQIKPQSKSKPNEKPLLHKVLRTTAFKANQAPVSRTKNMKVIPGKDDEVMEDFVTGIPVEEPPSV